jgi:hypothetical protein
MSKVRLTIPKPIRDAVLKEFRHKCAICGRHSPQVHHLDENPSNNDPLNLLPLCPNCHLQDIHDPTSPPDPLKLKLFRKFKDPLIFDPRFQPIFRRMACLRSVEWNKPTQASHAEELFKFIEVFQMGEFYRRQIAHLFHFPSAYYRRKLEDAGNPDFSKTEDAAFTKAAIAHSIEQIEFLIIEMLRYQGWNVGAGNNNSKEPSP